MRRKDEKIKIKIAAVQKKGRGMKRVYTLQNLLAEMQTIYTHSGRAMMMMMIIWHMEGGGSRKELFIKNKKI